MLEQQAGIFSSEGFGAYGRAGSSRGEQPGRAVPAEGYFGEQPYFRVGDRSVGAGIVRYGSELVGGEAPRRQGVRAGRES